MQAVTVQGQLLSYGLPGNPSNTPARTLDQSLDVQAGKLGLQLTLDRDEHIVFAC